MLSTHELDLALKAADTLWLINREGEVITGTPEDLVLEGVFESVFQRDSFDFDRSTGSFTLHNPQKKPVHLIGDVVPVFWTRRALEREGFKVRESNGTDLKIEAKSIENHFKWEVINGDSTFACTSIKDLLDILRKK